MLTDEDIAKRLDRVEGKIRPGYASFPERGHVSRENERILVPRHQYKEVLQDLQQTRKDLRELWEATYRERKLPTKFTSSSMEFLSMRIGKNYGWEGQDE